MPPNKQTIRKESQSQRQRFIEMAKEVEADETGRMFERAFGKIVPAKLHASDCAIHKGPSFESGQCTCGLLTARP